MATPRRRDNLNNRSNEIDRNFRRALSSGRQLSNVVGSIHGGLTGAVGAAGNLAEQIGMISRNAKLAAGALALGAIVSVGLTAFNVWKKATDEMKEFNATMNRIGSDTAIAQLQGISYAKDLEARRQAILAAGEQDLEQAKKIKNEEERRVVLAAIYKRTREQIAAVDRETRRDARRTATSMFDTSQDNIADMEGELLARSLPTTLREERARGKAQIAARKATRLRELQQTAAERGLAPEEVKALRERITREMQLETEILESDLTKMAFQVGDIFASSLADSISAGIETAIASGSIGKGFQALGATALSALGGVLQSYGVHALMAAKWLAALQKWLFANPVAAIPAAVGLIALGGMLKGIGGKWSSDISAGGGGGGGGGGFGGSDYGSGATSIIDRGLINPLNGVVNAPGTIAARSANTYNITVIGENDAAAQRSILRLIDNAEGRRG